MADRGRIPEPSSEAIEKPNVIGETTDPIQRFTSAMFVAALESGATEIYVYAAGDGSAHANLLVGDQLSPLVFPADVAPMGVAPYAAVLQHLRRMACVDAPTAEDAIYGRIELNISGVAMEAWADFSTLPKPASIQLRLMYLSGAGGRSGAASS